jgi:hypothetical protein
MVRAQHGSRGFETTRLEASSELQLDALEIKLLECKHRKRVLVYRRRQRLFAGRFVAANGALKAKAAAEGARPALGEYPAVRELLVLEGRRCYLFAIVK